MTSIEKPDKQIENIKRRIKELEDLLVSSVSADTVIIRPQRGESFEKLVKYIWDKKVPYTLYGNEFIKVSRIAYEKLKEAQLDVQQYSKEEMNRICDEEMRSK